MENTFHRLLSQQCESKQSRLCIGLDVDYNLLPTNFNKSIDGLFDFLKMVVDSTNHLCASYKLNMGFFEQFGYKGYQLMEKTVEYIDNRCFTIADGKRGDIGNSSKKYAESIFNLMGFNSATLSPYMGIDSITPFLEDSRFGVFVLCLTSNKGANDLQKKMIASNPLFLSVLDMINSLNNSNAGIVVGATQEDEMRLIRENSPNTPWLIPGIGKQGGNLEMSVNIGNNNGAYGIINVSRDILYYKKSTEEDIYERTLYYHNQIKGFLNE